VTDLLLIDGKHALWRAADAHSELSIETGSGAKMDTGAIYGFLRIICHIHEDFKPQLTVICWDDWEHGPRERRLMYPAYKDKGDFNALPIAQQEFIKSMTKQQHQLMGILDLLGARQAYSPGWEADDVMGTLADRYPVPAIIFTGDRDLLQCVTDRVSVARPGTGQNKGQNIIETPDTVKEQWGVGPERFVQLKALMGDSGDNIPGARGIGKVGAAKILSVYDTAAEAVSFAKADENEWPWPKELPKGLKEKLKASEAGIMLSEKLSRINTDVPLKFRSRIRSQERVTALFMKLKFKSLFIEGRLARLLEMGG
jgi:DNA polymerase I